MAYAAGIASAPILLDQLPHTTKKQKKTKNSIGGKCLHVVNEDIKLPIHTLANLIMQRPNTRIGRDFKLNSYDALAHKRLFSFFGSDSTEDLEAAAEEF